MSRAPRNTAPSAALHPRNRHQGHYDFSNLIAHCPSLARHVISTPAGNRSIDFSNPVAVKTLNRALLASQYGVGHWDIPDGFLCPPIPGRADYLHGLADLLAADHRGCIPRGAAVRVLDIGVGANCIYPLLGQSEYGWSFLGTDVDAAALAAAQANVDANGLSAQIELRRQADRRHLFAGVVRADERFAVSLCNPPFHASAADAAHGSERKWRNLGKAAAQRGAPTRNFAGRAAELWCPGGEAAFVRRMIDESAAIPAQVAWFSSLVSKHEHLAGLRARLTALRACEVRVVAMAQGNKQSRFLAWTFLDAAQRQTRPGMSAALPLPPPR